MNRADEIKMRITGRKAGDAIWKTMSLEFLEEPKLTEYTQRFAEAVIEQIKLRSGITDTERASDEQPPISRLGQYQIPFGKYNGKPFDEVPLSYLDWLCRNQEDFYKSLRAYLRHPELESRRRDLDT